MKTFIISYIISLTVLVVPFLSDVLARPFDILPRLAFYFAFPLSIFVAAIIILVRSRFGSVESKEQTVNSDNRKQRESDGLKEKKAA
ncbi:hypothetical protein KJ966_11765 [bacterium]|nr:hypothetical protein [bacterium]